MKINLAEIEEPFFNCWKASCSYIYRNIDEYGASDICNKLEEHFKKHFGIILIRVKNNNYVGYRGWGWSHLKFKNKEKVLLFLMEWS